MRIDERYDSELVESFSRVEIIYKNHGGSDVVFDAASGLPPLLATLPCATDEGRRISFVV